MPQSRFEPSFQNTSLPTCPKCAMPMSLARIEPEMPGFDKRTFECQGCDYTETVVIKFAMG